MDASHDYHQLDDLLATRIRLAIMTVLATVESVDFNTLKAKTNSTDGNLSVQIKKLAVAGYLTSDRQIIGSKTQTTLRITPRGQDAINQYLHTLESLLRPTGTIQEDAKSSIQENES